VGTRADLDTVVKREISSHTRELYPDLPARILVAMLTELYVVP